jgi:hypothetical protein
LSPFLPFFGSQFYEQVDGVAMGSPLPPIINSFFAEDFEEIALDKEANNPLLQSE